MLKALLTVLTMVGWLSTESGTYFILSAAGNAVFYFLPIFLGITLATKLGANPYVGGAIGAALLEPSFAGLLDNIGDRSDFLGIPVLLMDYSSSVFPVFIAVCIYAALNNLLKKVIHRDLHLFMLPLLSLLIIVPLTVLIFGPFGIYVGDAIGAAIGFLSSKSGILTGAVMGQDGLFDIVRPPLGSCPYYDFQYRQRWRSAYRNARCGSFCTNGDSTWHILKNKRQTSKNIRRIHIIAGPIVRCNGANYLWVDGPF